MDIRTRSMLPDMSRKYNWCEVAHTYDGYKEAGSFEACAERANALLQAMEDGTTLNDIATDDLRLALFFAARADRHSGIERDSYPREEAIVAELLARNGDEWMCAELERLRKAEGRDA